MLSLSCSIYNKATHFGMVHNISHTCTTKLTEVKASITFSFDQTVFVLHPESFSCVYPRRLGEVSVAGTRLPLPVADAGSHAEGPSTLAWVKQISNMK